MACEDPGARRVVELCAPSPLRQTKNNGLHEWPTFVLLRVGALSPQYVLSVARDAKMGNTCLVEMGVLECVYSLDAPLCSHP